MKKVLLIGLAFVILDSSLTTGLTIGLGLYNLLSLNLKTF